MLVVVVITLDNSNPLPIPLSSRYRDFEPWSTNKFISTLAVRDMAHSQSIEVEHKFVIPSDIDERLQRAGARLLKERSFSDIYVDNECNELAFLGKQRWIK